MFSTAFVRSRELTGDERSFVVAAWGHNATMPPTPPHFRLRFLRGPWSSYVALRAPTCGCSRLSPIRQPTLAEAADAWRASRVDVVEATGHMHRSALGRVFKTAPKLPAPRHVRPLRARVREWTLQSTLARIRG